MTALGLARTAPFHFSPRTGNATRACFYIEINTLDSLGLALDRPLQAKASEAGPFQQFHVSAQAWSML